MGKRRKEKSSEGGDRDGEKGRKYEGKVGKGQETERGKRGTRELVAARSEETQEATGGNTQSQINPTQTSPLSRRLFVD